ncbi:uncharacterized protein BDZ99DRAFT_508838 [Mytilinidion resinicola]|uniref:Zn(2)-C6 fungal-type domain-containing protein n=1 Tax=Mytilinidion resinicola TaxID=574789 RepID=A0A6A6YNQ4_9PEZI|nr:uncharacterized protein BDZ99DRAFT_508838 [Mytilinidion resinicola]KAF2810410.1 hypothetical protein BDZ99DRAFT_508838 [Mytilinidion resinicola]
MVFCGRPSKACQRCRERKLRCDLRIPSCGQCNRALAKCHGYRDTRQIQIRNESQVVRMKALQKVTPSPIPSRIRALPLSLEAQARDMFFRFYVNGFSTTWSFLRPFYHPTYAPLHLSMSIDCVSLAFVSLGGCADEAALVPAREKYASALRMTNKALQNKNSASNDVTILVSALLLDLFEKMTNTRHRGSNSWTSHIDGALGLVRLRGIDKFQTPEAVRILVRLSTNLLISCIAIDHRIPDELQELRDHASTHLNVDDPKWRVTDLSVQYANLRGDIRTGAIPSDKIIARTLELDAKYAAIRATMPPSWQYTTALAPQSSPHIYNRTYFPYLDRHITQTWNVTRFTRILLNELILAHCSASSPLADQAIEVIQTIVFDICAAAPQYIDCAHAASHLLPESQNPPWPPGTGIPAQDGSPHTHCPSQKMSAYTLIFPLFVAAQSRYSPPGVRSWIAKQMRWMDVHFGIRIGGTVAALLEKEGDVEVGAWTVYAMLGSYAFAA